MPELAKPQVRQAIKWAIDYDAIAKNITPDTWDVDQSFLPKGLPGALTDNPFKKDVAKAKAAAGGGRAAERLLGARWTSSPPRPTATSRRPSRQDLAAIGIKVALLPGEQKQVITKTRARTHQLAHARLGHGLLRPELQRPGVLRQPRRQRQQQAQDPRLAQPLQDDELTKVAEERRARSSTAPSASRCTSRCSAISRERAPFAIVLQKISSPCCARASTRLRGRPAARLHAIRRPRRRAEPRPRREAQAAQPGGQRRQRPDHAVRPVLVTFLIGRVMPIDPVIAIAGDHAPPDVVGAGPRSQLGLDKPLLRPVLDLSRATCCSGDLGRSVMTSHPVTQDIAHFFPATFELATAAIIIAIVVGVPLGVLAAVAAGHALRPCRPRRLPGRPVDPGLRARRCLSCWSSTPSSAGRRAPGRQDVVYRGHGADRHRHADHRRAARRRLGQLPRRARPSRACRRCVLAYFSHRLHRPHDARLHARRAARRIHRHRARQGAVGARASSGATPSAISRAARHRARADLCRPAGRRGA